VADARVSVATGAKRGDDSNPMRVATSLFYAPLVVLALGLGCSAANDRAGGGGPGNAGADGGGLQGIDANVDSALDEDAACGKATYDGKRVPASMLLLFDRSASMADNAKWTNGVSAMNAALATADNQLGVGLLLFPASKWKLPANCLLNFNAPGCPAALADGGCKDILASPNVPVDVLGKTRSLIQGALGATGPDGDNTPTRWALKNAWASMQSFVTTGDRYVVLVTDGEPTTHQPATSSGGISIPEMNVQCADLTTIEAETSAAAAGSPAVKTFAIGVPGSEPNASFLSSVAVNGKTAKPGCSVAKGDCHYQIGSGSFAADLQAALTEIAGKVASCIFQVPIGPDVQPGFLNVSVDTGSGQTPLYQDTSHADGWDYTDATQSRVEIYGPKCDAIKAMTVASVKILGGCKTRVR
jgi:hypothetical protein